MTEHTYSAAELAIRVFGELLDVDTACARAAKVFRRTT